MMKAILAASFCSVAVSACTIQSGTTAIDNFEYFTNLEPGETTKEDIHRVFGQPHLIRYTDQEVEGWVYFRTIARQTASSYIPYVGIATMGHDLDITEATFFFDDDGTFLRSDRHQSARYRNTWTNSLEDLDRDEEVDRIEAAMISAGLPFDEDQAVIDVSDAMFALE
jgi:outer membrane protein assembly factor BamE (lipoprotein component of BamABCDE complex)